MSNDPFKDVERATDGRLIASAFDITLCDTCDSGHFNLSDEQDRVFATAAIPPEHFRNMAAWFTDAAVRFEAKTGRKLD
jgi:hypothetical protein